MAQYEDFFLGNATLHLQLTKALAVMTQLICNASHPPTAQELSESMDIPLRTLRKMLRTLSAGGLLKRHEQNEDTWVCARSPHMVSLADIYQCLMSEKEAGVEELVAAAQAEEGMSSADLLMMQATMALNQLVQQHLQRFDLGRLKTVEPAMLSTAALREKAFSTRFFTDAESTDDFSDKCD